jgi:hypothetical protein
LRIEAANSSEKSVTNRRFTPRHQVPETLILKKKPLKNSNLMTALVPIAYFVGMVDIVRVYFSTFPPPHTQTFRKVRYHPECRFIIN